MITCGTSNRYSIWLCDARNSLWISTLWQGSPREDMMSRDAQRQRKGWLGTGSLRSASWLQTHTYRDPNVQKKTVLLWKQPREPGQVRPWNFLCWGYTFQKSKNKGEQNLFFVSFSLIFFIVLLKKCNSTRRMRIQLAPNILFIVRNTILKCYGDAE